MKTTRIQILVMSVMVLVGLMSCNTPNQKTPRHLDSDNFQFEQRWNTDKKIHEMWLQNKTTGQKSLVYKFDRSADAMLSPNAAWIVINNNCASNASDVALLRKNQNGEYDLVEKTDMEAKALELFRLVYGLKKIPPLDHLYIRCVGWSLDSKTLGMVMWGYESGRQDLGHWFFNYDVDLEKVYVLDPKALKKEGNPLKPIKRGE